MPTLSCSRILKFDCMEYREKKKSFAMQCFYLFIWWKRVQPVERQVDHRNVKWLTQYLCCSWTKMAEIWFPDTFFKDVYTCKILALHHFYFLSYDTFSWWISNFSGIEWFPWLSLYNSESISDRELKFCMCKHLENLWLKKNFSHFGQ